MLEVAHLELSVLHATAGLLQIKSPQCDCNRIFIGTFVELKAQIKGTVILVNKDHLH